MNFMEIEKNNYDKKKGKNNTFLEQFRFFFVEKKKKRKFGEKKM